MVRQPRLNFGIDKDTKTAALAHIVAAPESFHDYFPCHMRMQAAEIIVGAGAGERKRKRVVSVQRLRPEGLVLVDHAVRDVVVIDELHRGPNGNRELWRVEDE